MTWPQVGAEALLKGARAFQKDADDVVNSLERINRVTSRMGGASANEGFGALGAGVGIATTAVVLGVGAMVAAIGLAGTAVTALGAKFDESMHLTAATVGLSRGEVEKLGATIRDVGNSSAVSFQEIADAAGSFLRAGSNLETITAGGLQNIADFSDALGGEGGLEVAVTTVVGALNVYDLQMTETKRVTDALAAATITSAATMGTILTALAQIGPTAADAGLTIEDTTAAISMMGQRAILGGRAGTALKVMFTQLEGPSTKALELMKKFGLSMYDAQGAIVPFEEMVRRLQVTLGDQESAVNKLTDAERQYVLTTIFGSDGQRAALILAQEGVEGLYRMRDAFDSVNVARIAEEARNSLIPQLKIMQNIVMGLTTTMTDQYMPALTLAAKLGNIWLKSLDPAIPKAFGEAVKSIIFGHMEIPDLKSLGEFAPVLERIVSGAIAVRDALLTQLLPAFISLGRVIFGAGAAAKTGSEGFGTLTNAALAVIRTVSGVVFYAGQFIVAIRESASASAVLGAALQGALALALIGVGLLIARIVLMLPLMAISAAMTAVKMVASFALIGVELAFLVVRFIASIAVAIAQTILWAVVTIAQTIAIVSGMAVVDASYVAIAAAAVISLAIQVAAWVWWAASTIALAIAVSVAWAIANAEIILVAVLVVAAIVGLAIMAAFLYTAWTTNFLGIRDIVTSVFTFILGIFNTVVSGLIMFVGIVAATVASVVSTIMSFVSSLATANNQVQTRIIGTMTTIVTAVWDRLAILRKLATDFFTWWIDRFRTGFGAVVDVALVVFKTLGLIVGGAMQGIVDFLVLAFTKVGDLFVATGEFLVETWGKIFDFIVSIPGRAFNLIGTVLVTAFNWVSAAFAKLGNGILATWASAWSGVQGIAARAVKWVADKIKGLIDYLKTIPIIGGMIGAVQGFFAGGGGGIAGPPGVNTGTPFQGASDFDKVVGAMTTTWEVLSDVAGNFFDDAKGGFKSIGDLLKGDILDLSALTDAYKDLEKKRKDQERLDRERQFDPNKPTPQALAPIPPGFPPTDAAGGGAGKTPKGDGAGSKAEELAAIEDLVRQITADIPGMTDALIEFLAKLEQANPGRLAGMVAALEAQRTTLGQILVVQQTILAARLELIGVEQRLAALHAEQALIQAQIRVIELPYQRQIMEIRQQILAIDLAIAPARRQILMLDQQIAALQRENYALAIQQAEIELQALPIRQQIADIEKQINRVIDQRLALTRREAEIRAQLAGIGVDKQIKANATALDAAWANMDVDAIMRLEAQNDVLTEQKDAIDEQLASIRAQTEEQRLLDELKTIGYEQQKLDLLDILEPMQDQLDLLSQQKALEDARNAILILQLQAQRQALIDQIQPMLDQKALLQDMIDLIGFQQEAATAAHRLRLFEIGEQIAKEELNKAALDAIILTEESEFTKLVLGFASALTASEAFTFGESVEVAKRMGFWNDSISKIAEVAGAYDHVTDEVNKLSDAIRAIPTEVNVNVNVTTTQSGDPVAAGGGGNDTTTMKTGGVVPGEYGQPRWILAHGGERFLGLRRSLTPTSVQVAQSQSSVDRSVSSSYTDSRNIVVNPPPGTSSVERRMWRMQLDDIIRGTKR